VRFSISELAARLGGEQVGPDVAITGASIDSRTVLPGQLYVPIVAERDGHEFIRAALQGGAPAYLTAQQPIGGTAVVVADTAASLLRLGQFARERMGGGVVGVTGSVGKTTTKDLLRSCLASSFRVAASERSFNNELGLPLTLLNAPDDVEWTVLEMGARGAGHITRLAEIGRPDVGIVTSVAMAHVEYFGDLEGVARAKSELVTALPSTGVAILNADDPRVAAMASVSPCPVLRYAIEGQGTADVDVDADVRAERIVLDGDLRPRFHMATPWGGAEVGLAVHGLQQVPNALAAAAAALWCGAPLDGVVTALGSATGSPLRMEVRRVPNGPVLVVDCYNANPASTEAALRSMAALPAERKVALLGLMAELGAETDAEHRRVSQLAEDLGIEVVGYQTGLYGSTHVSSTDEAVALLLELGPHDAGLVKGSRVARLEDVIQRHEEAAGS
jgi:UDP-N-acetylmuramoyl-tripeptide--D-alanyl-D-alanine ligase